MKVIIRLLLISISGIFLTACAPQYVKMYDGPELDQSRIVRLKAANSNVKIYRLDGKSLSDFWTGSPNGVYILPGPHSISVAYQAGFYKYASGLSFLDFTALPGQAYYIRNKFYKNERNKIELSFWIVDEKGNRIFKKDDLASDITEVIRKYQNSFYKMDQKYHPDFFITLIRQDVIAFSWSRSLVAILISFGLRDSRTFDCNDFYLKLKATDKNIMDINDFYPKLKAADKKNITDSLVSNKKYLDILMSDYPFICKDRHYSEMDAQEAYKELLGGDINTDQQADAHWAWFSATGNKAILKKLLDNYLYVDKACKNCIEWSYRANASENKDVEIFLMDYMKDKSPQDHFKLLILQSPISSSFDKGKYSLFGIEL